MRTTTVGMELDTRMFSTENIARRTDITFGGEHIGYMHRATTWRKLKCSQYITQFPHARYVHTHILTYSQSTLTAHCTEYNHIQSLHFYVAYHAVDEHKI